MEENKLRFMHFSRKRDELAKRAYRTKRVHLVRMNTHPPVEIPMAKQG